MTEVRPENVDVRLLNRLYEEQAGELERLKRGGGGGTFDGMDARVNRLEARLDKITDRLGAVEVNLATLTERVGHLPSKDFIVKSVVGTGAVLGALSLFSAKLQALLGLAG